MTKERSQLISNLSEATHFELSKLVARVIDPFGRYQKFVFIAICWHSILTAISNTLTAFHIYTPDEYYCVDEDYEVCGGILENSTCVAGCRNYEFSGSDTSVVTEFNLVCDKRYLSALINTFYFSGLTIGSLVCGILADRFGRRKVIVCSLYLQGLLGASLYFVTSLEMFIAIRFVQGLFIPGLQSCSYTLLQELTPPRNLTLTGLTWESLWGLGMVVLGSIAYFVRDWRMLQLVLAIPTLISVAWIWLIPESPKWYLASNRKKLAVKQILQIADRNKDGEFFEECARIQAGKEDGAEAPLVEAPQKRGNILDLFRNRILLVHIIVMMTVWFSANWAYYGILLSIPNLAGERHLNFIIGAVIEIVAAFLAYFVLSSRLGRRISMICFQYMTSMFYVAFGVLLLLEGTGTWINVATATIALVGKGVAVFVIGGMHVYGAELFPTILRTTSTGMQGFSGRIGSLSAPQIVLLGEVTHPAVTMGIIACLQLISGTATFLVPETLNKKLPDTMIDAEEEWGKKPSVKEEIE